MPKELFALGTFFKLRGGFCDDARSAAHVENLSMRLPV